MGAIFHPVGDLLERVLPVKTNQSVASSVTSLLALAKWCKRGANFQCILTLMFDLNWLSLLAIRLKHVVLILLSWLQTKKKILIK